MAYTGSKAFAGRGTSLQKGNGDGPPETFTPIAELQQVQKSGSKSDQADVTNLDSTSGYREYIPTLVDGGEISFSGNYIPGDTTQQSLQTAFDTQEVGNWQVVLPAVGTPAVTLGHWAFKAFVTAVDFDITHDKEAKLSGKLKISGPPVFTPGA